MAKRKRPHLDEPTTYLNATIFLRQNRWLQRRADRTKVYPSSLIRDAIEIYRTITLAFDKTPLPNIKQLTITVRAALVAYLAQQRADTQAGVSPAGTDPAPQAEAEGGMDENEVALTE